MKRFLILFGCSLLAVRVQPKVAYKLKITRTEVIRANKVYLEGRMWITKPNRTTNAMNGELALHYLPRDAKVKVKAYEFLSNDYRPFAINLERDVCQFLELEYKMMLYPDLLKAEAHVPEPRCPVKPGNYFFANFTPDITSYPARLPFHNFMLELGAWHGPVEIGALRVYGTLDRDAVIREQYG